MVASVDNLVHETTTGSGTGNLTTVAVNGRRRFGTVFGTGGTTNVFYYFISSREATEWEFGTGHASALGTLVRDTVIGSSNANALVNFTASHIKDVFCAYPADKQEPAFEHQTLTDGATINWDTKLGRSAQVTIAATGRTMANPTNLKVGMYTLHVIQDGTGSRTITTWGSVFKWPGGVAPVLSTAASARDVLTFTCDGTNLYGTYMNAVA